MTETFSLITNTGANPYGVCDSCEAVPTRCNYLYHGSSTVCSYLVCDRCLKAYPFICEIYHEVELNGDTWTFYDFVSLTSFIKARRFSNPNVRIEMPVLMKI